MFSLAPLALLCTLQVSPTSIPASGTSSQADFGIEVALDGTTMLVGASRDFTEGLFAGSVHVYEQASQGGWSKSAVFHGEPFDNVGHALAIQGDVAVASGGGEGDRPVLVMERIQGQWQQTASLTHPSTGGGSGYGRSVDTDGDLIVVGSARSIGAGQHASRVFVYRKVGSRWTEIQRISLPPDPASPQLLARFGYRVALDGNRLAVSAPGYVVNGVASAGAVVTHTLTGGQFVPDSIITPPPLAGSTLFGLQGLSMHSGRIAVASEYAAVGGAARAGVVTVYAESSAGLWFEEASLPDPSPTFDGRFGSILDLGSDRLVASRFPYGRLQYGPGMLNPESYLRVTGPTGATWVRQPSIEDPFAANDSWFGSSVALSGDLLAVGCQNSVVASIGNGSAHVGSISTGWAPTASLVCTGGPCSCPSTTGWEGCGSAFGSFGRLTAIGSASVSADDLQLNALNLGGAGLAQLTLGPGLARPMALGDGALCVQSPMRLAPVMRDGIGRVTFPTGVVALAASQLGSAGMILAGETWVFQVVYDAPSGIFPCPGQYGLDPGTGLWNGRPFLPARGFNLTNGLAVTFRP